jgi:membrane associated rhomboid family serine protease
MRDVAGGRHSTPVTNAIAAANAVVFLLWLLPAVPTGFMAEHFLISWSHLAAGRVWTILSAVFSHNLLFHLLINMIVLFSFGAPLERLLGPVRFLAFFLAAGAVGSLAHAAVSQFLIGRPGQAALGASSALSGILLLFALVFPRAKVLLFLLIPVPAIVAAFIFIGLDIWGLIAQVEGAGLPIGHGAHLGGALAGILYYVLRGSQLRNAARPVWQPGP